MSSRTRADLLGLGDRSPGQCPGADLPRAGWFLAGIQNPESVVEHSFRVAVLAFAIAYDDASYLLASHASEVWMDPLGSVLTPGPGGSQLYYKGLLDKLGVTAHIYRVDRWKRRERDFQYFY